MLSTAESEAPSNDERINILSSHSGWRSILDTREMNSGSLFSWVPNAIIVSSFKGVMCLTHIEEDLIRILAPIYTVGRARSEHAGWRAGSRRTSSSTSFHFSGDKQKCSRDTHWGQSHCRLQSWLVC